jgi:hypothetical protein
MYLVHATPPSKMLNKGWTFKPGHFPRKVHYKNEALALAQEAKAKGATNVKLEKIK